MKCVCYHPYFPCFRGSPWLLYKLAVQAGTLQTWWSVIIQVSRISKCACKRDDFLISWIEWHLQSTNGSLICWFLKNLFITSEGEYCFFALRNLHTVTNEASPSSKRLHVSRIKYTEVPYLYCQCTHSLPYSWILMQPLWYCSSIWENYVVLVSVGFTTWVGKLNETCYTPLNSEFLWSVKWQELEVNIEWVPERVVFSINR